jgi:type I restriction enzyme S subunit
MSEGLGQHCTLVRGVNFQNGDARREGEEDYVPVLRAGNISRTLDLRNDLVWVPNHLVSEEQRLRIGDIAICLSSGSADVVGKTARLDEDWNGTVGAFCGIVRPNSNVDSEYLAHWFRSQQFWKWRDSQARGGSIQNLRFSGLAQLDVSFPPLEEQRRIAGRLSAQLSILAEARAALEAQLAAAKSLPTAHLRAVFEKEAKCWQRIRLEEVSEIAGGVTLGRDFRGRPTRNVPYLRVANVKDGHLDLTTVKTTPATEEEIAACRLQRGDVLLTEGGDPDKLGRGTFWNEEISECIHQNHIFRVRFDLIAFEPSFVGYQLASAYGKAYFLRHAKQTTGIATINRRVLGAFPLRIPSLAEQRRIAAGLDAKFSASASLRSSVQGKLRELEKLPAALLREAFSPNGT